MNNTKPKLEVLTSEEFQEIQAEQLEQELNHDKQAENTGNLIVTFVTSYEKNKATMPLEQWLVTEFQNYPNIWQDDADIINHARDVISTITRSNEAKASLYEHTEQGKSQSSWVAKQVELGAKSAGIVNVGEYAGQIESAIERANVDMASTILRNDGNISQALNLDGFIAEQHHVDTFNLDAVTKGSSYRAKVLVPDGTAYGKNSMDIGIYDAEGKLVRRFQSKYGQDADATKILFDRGDYRGQRKLVPAGHAEHIDGATERVEIDNIQSKPLTKEESKALQEKAQLHEESKTYDWNDVTRGEVAKKIGKQALIGAGLVAGFHGARVFGRRMWNSLLGKENHSLSEDLQEFFESSLKSSAQVGVQVAVSGAIVVSAKNGWLGSILRKSPAKNLAAIAYVGMENAKVLYKLAKGELTGIEAVDAMGKTTASLTISLAAASAGAVKGASIGMVFGPIGAVAGGLIGSIAGGMAGGKVGEYIYDGGKSIVKSAISLVNSTASAVSEGLKKLTGWILS